MRLAGFVRNAPSGVEIEIEGNRAHLREFRRRLQAELPPAAAIDRIESERSPLRNDTDFVAMPSERGRTATTIPPDLAACSDCVREILDPADRRYRYPFTNCTSCGPRFTVVRALPMIARAPRCATFRCATNAVASIWIPRIGASEPSRSRVASAVPKRGLK